MIKVAVQRAKPESKKSKAVRYFAGFLVFMLICTIISRGIYAYRLPQVTVQAAERKAISHTIETNGVVEYKTEKAVVVMGGIRVSEILVQEGEKVKEGDALFLLDMEDLEKKRELCSQELTVMEQRLSETKESQTSQETARRKEKERAEEDWNKTVSEQEELLEEAEKAYEEAVKELEEFASFESYYQGLQEKSAEYQSLKNAAEKPEATEEERESFQTFEQVFRADAEEGWKQKQSELEHAAGEKARAVDNAQKIKDNAIRDAERRLEDASTAEPQINSSVAELANSISYQKDQMDAYNALIEADGTITSSLEGTVQRINVSTGEWTTDGAAMILSDSAKGVQFIASISAEERELLSEGILGTLSFSNGRKKVRDLPVEVLLQQEDGSYRIRVDVNGMGFSQGETGSLLIDTEKTVYECCVPLSSVYSSGMENYVLVLKENETFLGTEYSVERRNVIIKEQSDGYAALEDNSVGNEEKVIVSSDREVTSGDIVRMKEG